MIDTILLISGGSKRMGSEKSLLPFSESKSFVCHLIETYLSIQNVTVFVLVNCQNSHSIKQACKKFEHRVVFIENPNPEKGRFWSILTGLKRVKKGRGVFIQNIDNPNVSKHLLCAMVKNYQADSFLVPRFEGKNGHPLLLGAKLVQELQENAGFVTDLKSFLNGKEKHILITNERGVLANINSPAEYKKWFPDIKFKSEA